MVISQKTLQRILVSRSVNDEIEWIENIPPPSLSTGQVSSSHRTYDRTEQRACNRLVLYQGEINADSGRNTPIAYSAIAPPLFSCGIMSAILAPPRVTGQTPKHPAKKRNTMS